MDIEEIIKYSKNKIESDDLTKQVRSRIKETAWDKQNKREGFSETFKPLISQFEKPDDPKKKNVFTQNQEMLRNQLALTEGLRDNQRAITQGFSQFERLADMKELPGVEAIEEEEDKAPIAKEVKAPIAKEKEAPIKNYDEFFNRYLLNKKAQDLLLSYGYDKLPSYYLKNDISELEKLIENVNLDKSDVENDIKNTSSITTDIEGYRIAIAKADNPRITTKNKIDIFNLLSIYSLNLSNIFNYRIKTGSGINFYFSPQELLKRFELVVGSLAAGNNGVLPEYIQIAHRLRDLGVITNNQLNKLLKSIYS